MEISLLLMQQIAQLFLILIMGYAVVKAGLLKASDSRVLSVVMVYLVTPCVIINAFQIDDTPEIRKGLLYSMAIAAAIHVVLLVLSALLSRPLKLDAVEQVNVIYSNAAALVIPLVKALMGDAYVIYSCAFIIVQLVLLWTHASSLLQGSSALDWKKVLTNINMIAIAAGALLYWFRVVLPAPLQNTMSTVGNMMGPMGMLLAGMAIAEKPLREVFCTRRNYLPTVLRLVVFTSFDEEMKGAEPVQSTFLVDMEKLFDAALAVPEISGIILNPWNRTIQLDKTLIRIIKGA